MNGILSEQLPWVLGTDERFAAFVDLLDPISTSLYERAGDKHHLFDTQIAPIGMVRWLAALLGVHIGTELSDRRQRDIALTASHTFARRGTAGSLAQNLQVVTQAQVQVFDTGGVVFEPMAQVAEQALAAARSPRTRIEILADGPVDEAALNAVIERELPAHIPIDVSVVQRARSITGPPDASRTAGDGDRP